MKHNWLKTIYINYKLLPFKQAVRLPFVVIGGLRIVRISGKVKLLANKLYPGMIKIGSQGSDMFPRTESVLSLEGLILINSTLVVGTGSSIISKSGSKIIFGPNTILGAHNLVFCEKEISFGEDFLSSWDCQFMDTDTHSIWDTNTGVKNKSVNPISVGNHVWIGNGVTINKGTILPTNTIVASQSLCNKDYSEIGQGCIIAGMPAKVVSNNKRWGL